MSTVSNGTNIDVHEVFSSVQCEGSMTGTPMTFIRLWGCNLSCSFCDTPQSISDRHETTIRALTAAAIALENKWVCITGGEPTIHDNFDVLVETLQAADLEVAVETNGTIRLASFPNWVCVSPKINWVESELHLADEIKVLVGSDLYDAGGFIVTHTALVPKMCLQPVWSASKHITDENVRWALRLCHKYQVRLSLQLHKYIGVK